MEYEYLLIISCLISYLKYIQYIWQRARNEREEGERLLLRLQAVWLV